MENGEYHYHQQVHYSPCGGGERDGIGQRGRKAPQRGDADFGGPHQTRQQTRTAEPWREPSH